MPKRYPREMRMKARRLVRTGVPKIEVSKMMGVSYVTIYFWTRGLEGRKGRQYMCGRTLDFLRTIVRRGYILSGEVKEMSSRIRTLGKHLPIRRVRFSNRTVWYLAGREREAMEALLKSMNKKSIGYNELGRMRRAFGIKNIKRDNKIMGRNFK